MGDAGECQTSNKKEYDEEEDETTPPALDEGDIALLKTYGLGPYTTSIKNIEKEIAEAKVGGCSSKGVEAKKTTYGRCEARVVPVCKCNMDQVNERAESRADWLWFVLRLSSS